ncbi:transcriptional regulator [Alphaproteobacteria bacterium HT1-32]|nr:transcriptional regulator [Alphaproteobacteria bacterium HT1-32]|tara:strand:+ start:29159 stop:29470 length:312 start_codon:yes stop_codon:yes gene_type:complete
MQTHTKKRIEIIIEAPVLNRLVKLLGEQGVRGHTVLPVMQGSGAAGDWERQGMIIDAGRMVMVIAIVDPSVAREVLEAVHNLLSRHIGVISMTDTEVIRDEHF